MDKQIPPAMVPLLQKAASVFPHKKLPLAFWTSNHGPTILDGFSALAPLVLDADVPQDAIPHGYRMLACLFDWEAQCQFNGWGAFENVSEDDFSAILAGFTEVGLVAEADSLRAQMDAFRAHPDDLEQWLIAAQEGRHAFSGDLDRLEYLTQYFCDHADRLLYIVP
ncbi:MAG TPA: hypothetical protein VGC21_19135 [Telluria sp.]|jgi:hypothetical protein